MQVRHDMVCCYVVRKAGGSHEFLQMRRSHVESLSGTWQTVYGCMEGDEPAWQCALRELREEAGLAPTEFYRLGLISSFYIPDTLWHVTNFCAIVDFSATVTLNIEHDAFRWIPRNQLNSAFMWPTDRQAIEHCVRDILDDGPAKPYLRIPLP